jgi:meso-butanediol dehydrogenase / (S,S)-butanediol dehydrogenase / diacetyl reductase
MVPDDRQVSPGLRRFHDRVVLITGAASGIGRATAIRLAAEGATLALTDVNAEGLAATEAECRAEGATQVNSGLLDVADEAAVEGAIAEVVGRFGRLDVLANVAGILRFEDFRRTTTADWQQIIAVNLTGTFLTCRAALPHLLEARGNVVNVASTAALAGHPWTAPYSASKGGVLALSLTLAVEFGKLGLRCNVVAPGSIETPIQEQFQLPEGADAKLLYRIMALDRMRGPEAVAGAIAFLASDDAAHVNGEVLRVDGGTLA